MKIDKGRLQPECRHRYPLPYGWGKSDRKGLSDETVRAIKRDLAISDMSHKQPVYDRLAKKYKVGYNTIQSIYTGFTYKHVTI
jgi:hypothetical protein